MQPDPKMLKIKCKKKKGKKQTNKTVLHQRTTAFSMFHVLCTMIEILGFFALSEEKMQTTIQAFKETRVTCLPIVTCGLVSVTCICVHEGVCVITACPEERAPCGNI